MPDPAQPSSHYKPISSPIHLLRHYYPVVVVGSGYGGAVAACRLARATYKTKDGREHRVKVCVLERGREMLPTEFPDTLDEASRHFQADIPTFGHVGPRAAVLDFRLNEDMQVLVGCGLGGGSLINASVGMVPGNLADPEDSFWDAPDWRQKVDPFWLDSRWPGNLRDDLRAVSKGYADARAILEPNPDRQAATLPKYQALGKFAKSLGREVYPVDVYVNFDAPRTLPWGVVQNQCNRCGDCITGCKYEAKGTLAMNYLPDAWRHGADLFTGVEVREIERRPGVPEGQGRWLVHFELIHDLESLHPEDRHSYVLADHVVLAAGTLGSTEILLRSRDVGMPHHFTGADEWLANDAPWNTKREPLQVSNQLGKHFSGNGDFTGFAHAAKDKVQAIGWGQATSGPKVGACITGGIEGTATDAAGKGHPYVIEDAVMAGALDHTPFSTILDLLGNLIGTDRDEAIAAAPEKLLAGAAFGSPAALAHTLMLLGNALDTAGGEMHLDEAGRRLSITWPGVGGADSVLALNDEFEKGSTDPNGLDATYIPEPIWGGKRLLTVHPLGGCRMADDAGSGVVDHLGRVFDTAGGVHEGLYVLDGSIVPLPIGRNPSLTIAALAERAVRGIARTNKWTIDEDFSEEHYKTLKPRQHGERNPFDRSAPGLSFHDHIRGYFSTSVKAGNDDQLSAYVLAYDRARPGSRNPEEDCEVVLDVDTYVDDIISFLRDRTATFQGTVSIPVLSPRPLITRHGRFQLFTPNKRRPNTLNMRYRTVLEEQDTPRRWFLDGFKEIRKDHYWNALEFWKDTTTLYFTVCDGDRRGGKPVGKGIMHVRLEDFATLLLSIRRDEDSTLVDGLVSGWKFGEFFMGNVLDTYLWFLRPTKVHPPRAPKRSRRCLDLHPMALETHPVPTGDSKNLLLTRLRGGRKGPVLLTHGLGSSSLTFTLDTLKPNLAEYLCGKGYDVWLLDYRASTALPYHDRDFTGDDVARYDYPAAVEKVLDLTGAGSIQVVAHCFGSMTFHMAMLSGLSGVRAAVCSQVGLHPLAPAAGWLKAIFRAPSLFRALGIKYLDASPEVHRSPIEVLGDKVLQFVGSLPWTFNEWCRDATCQRCTFMFGRLYSHKRLNRATHESATELFGNVRMRTFEHSALMVEAERLLTAAGSDVYLEHLDRLAIPIRYLHGADNAVFLPESTRRTMEALARRNGPELYDRVVIPDYGHIDCLLGRDAARDVYPHILEHLDKTCNNRKPRA